jgi:hypothetical protein
MNKYLKKDKKYLKKALTNNKNGIIIEVAAGGTAARHQPDLEK